MPKVETRKARKDYPREGIKAGDTYYYTKLKLQRGGIIKRSLKPFKPSQLTTSAFKGGWFGAQEGWDEGDKSADDIRALAEAIREVGKEAQSSFDNMPEGLQQGDTGESLQARAEACESKADEIEALADEMEGLEEPDEEPVDPGEEADEDERGAYEDELSDWESACDEYESEMARIKEEVDGTVGDMPE